MVWYGCILGNSPLGVVDMNHVLDKAVDRIAASGPYGYLYFALVYIAAEMLAIPVFPLTASSGYLFGLVPGYCTVLISATLAAMASFFIGRTLLREWATQFTSKWPKWTAIDKAIAKEGLKVITLLRLSPLLPFFTLQLSLRNHQCRLLEFQYRHIIGLCPRYFWNRVRW